MPQIEVPTHRFSRIRTRVYDAQNDPNAILTAIMELVCPVGTVIPTLADSEPGEGWKICNGQALSKADFPRLYDLIGDTFGSSADSFNLPDLRERFPMGAGTTPLRQLGGAASVSLTVDQLPAHSHGVADPGHGHTFVGTPHSHSITDPGHTHAAAIAQTGTGGSSGTGAVAGSTGSATTGITVAPATAGGTVQSATTGITINETGAGEAVDILPPFVAVNWMVRT